MDRQTLRDWVHHYNAEGIAGLGERRTSGRMSPLGDMERQALAALVEAGPDPAVHGVVRWRRVDLQKVLKERLGVEVHERTVGKYLTALGYRRLSVRPQHPDADPEAQEAFKKTSAKSWRKPSRQGLRTGPLEIWFQDEARIGQQGTLTRIWAKRETRPRAPRDQRYNWAYLFGAACPARAVTAAIVTLEANAATMTLHLEAISAAVEPAAHAAVLVDGAGYHRSRYLRVPSNITLIRLPRYAPELNSAENIWEYLRKNKLSNTIFDSYDDILNKTCEAWRFFDSDKATITSITQRDWAKVN